MDDARHCPILLGIKDWNVRSRSKTSAEDRRNNMKKIEDAVNGSSKVHERRNERVGKRVDVKE